MRLAPNKPHLTATMQAWFVAAFVFLSLVCFSAAVAMLDHMVVYLLFQLLRTIHIDQRTLIRHFRRDFINNKDLCKEMETSILFLAPCVLGLPVLGLLIAVLQQSVVMLMVAVATSWPAIDAIKKYVAIHYETDRTNRTQLARPSAVVRHS